MLPPAVSTEVNEGRGWVSKKGDMIFFTRCPEEKGKENRCGLYMAKKQGSTWGLLKNYLSVWILLLSRIQVYLPILKVLYFVTNMKGGYGKTDIWSCTYDAKTNSWGQPKNAGPLVNTEGNEVYPSISDDGKKIIFLF